MTAEEPTQKPTTEPCSHNFVQTYKGCGIKTSEWQCSHCYTFEERIDSSCSEGNGDGMCDNCCEEL